MQTLVALSRAEVGSTKMANSFYKIAYVERGDEELWRKFWVTGEHTARVKKAHEEGRLGHADFIEASSLNDAMSTVVRKHPGASIMAEGSDRVGAA